MSDIVVVNGHRYRHQTDGLLAGCVLREISGGQECIACAVVSDDVAKALGVQGSRTQLNERGCEMTVFEAQAQLEGAEKT